MPKMKAALFVSPHQIRVEEVEIPSPGPDEVIVKVECCGICGTDYHILEGDFISPYPIAGGHEFSGTVYEVGEGVDEWTPGERVAVDPSVYCGSCVHCRNHRWNHCKRWNAIGVTMNGAFAEYVRVPAKNLYRLPEGISFEEGALIEPLSCVAYALNRIQPKFGERALIFGGGPMGLMLLMALKTSGTSEVVLVDIAEKKLETAKRLGADAVYQGGELLESRLESRYPDGFDLVVDATGIPAVIEGMFRFAGPGARLLQFGVAPSDARISVNPFDIYHKDWQYIGSMALMFNFCQALWMIEQKRVNVGALVTKKIGLESFADYMREKKPPEDIKVLVCPGL